MYRKKRVFLTVYLSEEKKKTIEEKAKAFGVSVSTYLKLKALGRIKDD